MMPPNLRQDETKTVKSPTIFLYSILGLACLALVSSCQKAKDNKDGMVPKVEFDVPYVPNSKLKSQTLDLLIPPNKSGDKIPVVVWIHGGAWEGGDKRPAPAPELVQRGIAVAAINYRLSGEAPFPAQIHDCKAAVRFLRANAQKYNLDPDKIGVWGMSAGGHLAALLGTSGGDKSLEGDGGNPNQSSKVQAVCDWCGITDIDKLSRKNWTKGSTFYKLFGGSRDDNLEKVKLASPVKHVTSDDPPFLIMHGDSDKTVSILQSEELKQALDAAGVKCDFEIVKNGQHFFFEPNELKRVANFFQSQFSKTSE